MPILQSYPTSTRCSMPLVRAPCSISVRLMSRARRANAPELAHFSTRYFVNGAPSLTTLHAYPSLAINKRADPALETGDERVDMNGSPW